MLFFSRFYLKFDTIAVVLVAGIATGLVGGLSVVEIIEIIGSKFIANRYMSIFLVSLPVIGLLERYGLRERAAYLINKMKSVTVLFWAILGCLFIFGKFMPSLISGLLIIVMGILSASKKVTVSNFQVPTSEESKASSEKIGSKIFIPALTIGIVAFFFGQFVKSLGGSVIGVGNITLGVIAYCLGMAIFTIIMGNAFAAFQVMTIGIGIPFVISQGGNPAIVGILGLTAGYCGTLLTPMAANFNIVPASVLGIDNKNKVIIEQAAVAGAMWLIHIVLMLVLAF